MQITHLYLERTKHLTGGRYLKHIQGSGVKVLNTQWCLLGVWSGRKIFVQGERLAGVLGLLWIKSYRMSLITALSCTILNEAWSGIISSNCSQTLICVRTTSSPSSGAGPRNLPLNQTQQTIFCRWCAERLENPLAFLFLFFNLRECPAGVLWLPGYNIKGYFKTGWTAHLSKNWENSCLKVQTILILCWQKMKTKTENETLAFWTAKQHQGDATGRWCGMHSHR